MATDEIMIKRLTDLNRKVQHLASRPFSDYVMEQFIPLFEEAESIAQLGKLEPLINNLRQTRTEQLREMRKCKNKPKKRGNAWDRLMSNFLQDISYHLPMEPTTI